MSEELKIRFTGEKPEGSKKTYPIEMTNEWNQGGLKGTPTQKIPFF